MKTILVPTDFSSHALNAVKYALAYAGELKAKVILFHAYDEPTDELDVPFSNVHYGKIEARQGAEESIKKLVTRLLKTFPDARLKWVVKPGIGAQNIVDYINQNDIPLVIMGTTGQGAISRALIGSTTSAVIKKAPCNIIAVPPKAKFKGIHTIAVATDLHADNLKAISEAVSFARKMHAELAFVHVEDLEESTAEKALHTMAAKIKAKVKYRKISLFICRDTDIAIGLGFFIRKNKPDMFTMVTHPTKFPASLWKTSWTDKMVNHISVPLLVLHTQKQIAEIKKAVKKARLLNS